MSDYLYKVQYFQKTVTYANACPDRKSTDVAIS